MLRRDSFDSWRRVEKIKIICTYRFVRTLTTRNMPPVGGSGSLMRIAFWMYQGRNSKRSAESVRSSAVEKAGEGI